MRRFIDLYRCETCGVSWMIQRGFAPREPRALRIRGCPDCAAGMWLPETPRMLQVAHGRLTRARWFPPRRWFAQKALHALRGVFQWGRGGARSIYWGA